MGIHTRAAIATLIVLLAGLGVAAIVGLTLWHFGVHAPWLGPIVGGTMAAATSIIARVVARRI